MNWSKRVQIGALLSLGLLGSADAAYVDGNPITGFDPKGLANGASAQMWMKMPPPPVRGPVVICHRPINISWIPSSVSDVLPQHHWVKTPTQEAGMGADCPVPGQQCSDMPYSSTTVVNHAGESAQGNATCDAEGDDIDVECVNRLLQVGRSTGAWTVTNQCMTFSYETIAQCRRRH